MNKKLSITICCAKLMSQLMPPNYRDQRTPYGKYFNEDLKPKHGHMKHAMGVSNALKRSKCDKCIRIAHAELKNLLTK